MQYIQDVYLLIKTFFGNEVSLNLWDNPPLKNPYGFLSRCHSTPHSYYTCNFQQLTSIAPALCEHMCEHSESLLRSFTEWPRGFCECSALRPAKRTHHTASSKALLGKYRRRRIFLKEGLVTCKAGQSKENFKYLISKYPYYYLYLGVVFSSPPISPSSLFFNFSSSAFLLNSVSSCVCRVLIIFYFGALKDCESSHLLGD